MTNTILFVLVNVFHFSESIKKYVKITNIADKITFVKKKRHEYKCVLNSCTLSYI